MSLVSPCIAARIIKLGGAIPAAKGRLLAARVRLSTQGFIDAMGSQWASHRAGAQPVSLEIPDLIINAVVPSVKSTLTTIIRTTCSYILLDLGGCIPYQCLNRGLREYCWNVRGSH